MLDLKKSLFSQLQTEVRGYPIDDKKRHFDFEKIYELIHKGANLNYIENEGDNSIFMEACLHWKELPVDKYKRHIGFLITQGAEREYRNDAGYNAMSWVALHGNSQNMTCLLELGVLPFNQTITQQNHGDAKITHMRRSIFHFMIKEYDTVSYQNFKFLLDTLDRENKAKKMAPHKQIIEYQRYAQYWAKINDSALSIDNPDFEKIGHLLQSKIEQTQLLQKISVSHIRKNSDILKNKILKI